MKFTAIIILLIVLFANCAIFKQLTITSYSYKYVELPCDSIKIGHSNELFEPCDTITEFPSKRKFVVVAIQLKRDTTWVYCPKYKPHEKEK